MSRETKHLAAALVLAACCARALAAETVYVPLPAGPSGELAHQVQVDITNPGHASGTIEVLQIGSTADAPPRLPAMRRALAAGQRLVLQPQPTPGVLEVTADPGVAVAARLVAARPAGDRGVELPAIPSDAAGAAGETVFLQGLASSATRRTDLVVVNLGREGARCAATARRADGSILVDAVSRVIASRAHFRFSDAFGGESLDGGRLEVTCDSGFVAFAQLRDSVTGKLAITAPAVRRRRPAERGTTCPAARAGTTCFAWPGVVHTATEADPVRHIYPPVAPGTYGAVHVRLEVQVNGWNRDHKPNAAHGVLYFVRNNNREMWASLLLRPLGILGLRHGFFKTHGEKFVVDRKFRAELGRTYVFDYLYDTRNRRVTLRVLLDGREVERIQGRPDLANVTVRRRDKVWIGLSNPGLYKPEPFSRGWVYKNLLVEFL